MGGTAHPRVAFRVLGPLEAVVDGRTVALGSPKVRQLLAALLVNANTVVSSDRLVEILWGESAPMDASGALQKTVHRLRSLLKATPGPTTEDADVLVTRAPGYVLTVDAESYDAAHLEELVADAQRSSELGDPRAALRRARRRAGALARRGLRRVSRPTISLAPKQRGSKSCASPRSRNASRHCSRWVATTRSRESSTRWWPSTPTASGSGAS